MATTTNYGWTTPDDTALVKDGASAIRTLGSSVDTTVKALNPGTTSGDLDYYTAATTKARIAKGTAGQVFTMNAGATAPEWQTISAGGMTLISTTTLSGATTTLSSIPQTYNSLFLIISGVTGNTSNTRIRCLPNNVNNLSDYQNLQTASIAYNTVNDAIRLTESNYLRTNANNAWVLKIDNYTSTTSFKPLTFNGFYVDASSVNTSCNAGGVFRSNTAITSLVFDYSGTSTFAGGTVLLYGVK
jgi:hypothetical protein